MAFHKATKDALTPQQQLFAAYFAEGFKPVDAARAAGYKAPDVAAHHLQRSQFVMRRVGEILKDTGRRLDCLAMSGLARAMDEKQPIAVQLKAIDTWLKHRPQDLVPGGDEAMTLEDAQRLVDRLQALAESLPPEQPAPMIDVTPSASEAGLFD